MTWSYQSASFRGSKVNPQPGDSVTVMLVDDSEEPQTRQFTYGYDGTKTKAQFVAMVKQEVKAHLAQLNGALASGDATADFDPS